MASKFEKFKKLGDRALEKGKYQEALQYFEHAIRVRPKSPIGWTQKAAAEIYLRKLDDAIKSSDEALKLDRKNADAWFNRGLALDKRRKTEEALTNYDYALRYNPSHIKALNNKGTIFGQLERWDDAKQCFEQVLKLEPDNEDAKENLKLLSDFRAGKHKRRCFIATAAYGSPSAPEINILRRWRDFQLMHSQTGVGFVNIYYKMSPYIARIISKSNFQKAIVRFGLRSFIIYLLFKYEYLKE